jgi:hypothetical protein
VNCPYCNAKMHLGYPGDDPENGPKQYTCNNCNQHPCEECGEPTSDDYPICDTCVDNQPPDPLIEAYERQARRDRDEDAEHEQMEIRARNDKSSYKDNPGWLFTDEKLLVLLDELVELGVPLINEIFIGANIAKTKVTPRRGHPRLPATVFPVHVGHTYIRYAAGTTLFDQLLVLRENLAYTLEHAVFPSEIAYAKTFITHELVARHLGYNFERARRDLEETSVDTLRFGNQWVGRAALLDALANEEIKFVVDASFFLLNLQGSKRRYRRKRGYLRRGPLRPGQQIKPEFSWWNANTGHKDTQVTRHLDTTQPFYYDNAGNLLIYTIANVADYADPNGLYNVTKIYYSDKGIKNAFGYRPVVNRIITAGNELQFPDYARDRADYSVLEIMYPLISASKIW